MVESVTAGLDAAHPSSRGIIIFPADHPLVIKDTLCKLIQKHQNNRDNIIIPLYKDRKGHPSLFPKTILKDIYSGLNLREIIRYHLNKVSYCEVNDEGVVLDMDTEEDYKRICKKFEKCIKRD